MTSYPPTLFIVGPTAVGKTGLAIALARRLNGEIVNADSRQVYRCMDIGTAKPTREERCQAVHHLLDLLSPNRNFNLGSFVSLANQSIFDIAARGCRPIVAGGTGQYIWALLEGWKVPEVAPDMVFRQACEEIVARSGGNRLYQQLQELDPARAAEIPPTNIRRIIRALEIHHATGRRPSSYRKRSCRRLPSRIIGLTLPREQLYQRIDLRVDQMMSEGFLDEVKRLDIMGFTLGTGPLNCPGYRELGQYRKGELTLEEAVQRTKFRTHRLARRQYAWFKSADRRIHWLAADSPHLAEECLALLSQPPLNWG